MIRRCDVTSPAYDAEFLTVRQVAERLRISKMSAYRLISRGELHGAKKFGHTIRVPGECLDEYIRQATIK